MKIVLLAQFNPVKNKIITTKNTKEEKLILDDYIIPIYETLLNLGHIVICETNPLNLIKYKDMGIDMVFSLYTRVQFKNYEVFISSLCNFINLRLNGATYNIKSLAEDKVFAKIFARNLNIATPNWFELSCKEKFSMPILPFKYPYFVKPRFSGASYGIDENSYCENEVALKRQFEKLSKYKVDCIVEEFIDGILLTIPIISYHKELFYSIYSLTCNSPNGIISHKLKRGLDDKYSIERNFLNEEDWLETLQSAILLFKALKDCKYARFDFLLDKKTNKVFFIEFNTCPNIRPKSGFYLSLKDKYHWSYGEFIGILIDD